jgi:hypothetical protein
MSCNRSRSFEGREISPVAGVRDSYNLGWVEAMTQVKGQMLEAMLVVLDTIDV